MADNEQNYNDNKSSVTGNGTYEYGYHEQREVGRRQAEQGITTAIQQPGESHDAWNYRQEGMDNG